MLTSSGRSTSSAIRAVTFSIVVFGESCLLACGPSKSNVLCSVLAPAWVPSTSMFAAAIPVGAAARVLIFFQIPYRYTYFGAGLDTSGYRRRVLELPGVPPPWHRCEQETFTLMEQTRIGIYVYTSMCFSRACNLTSK